MTRKRLWLHYFGMITSFICLIHCLITPILIVVFPLLISPDAHDIKYEIFFLLLLVFASVSFWQGYTIHKSRRSLIVAGVGLTLLIGSILTFENHIPFANHMQWSMVMSVLGGICMLLAHYWNYKLCRCHGHHH
jgi:hypothetical protein